MHLQVSFQIDYVTLHKNSLVVFQDVLLVKTFQGLAFAYLCSLISLHLATYILCSNNIT